MHEALLKRVQTALALAVLDCNRDMTALLEEVKHALSPALPSTPLPVAALVPLSTVRDALEVAELAWQIDVAGDAGETLNGLAFNLLPKLRALLPPGLLEQGGGGTEEGEDFRAQLKRIITPAGGARRKGVGEEVIASGLTAESKGKAFGFGPTFHQMTGGSTEFLVDLEGDRRFWPVRGEVQSSGLAAEGDDAAANSSTPAAVADDATKGKPGAEA